jgi:hypothetical protein
MMKDRDLRRNYEIILRLIISSRLTMENPDPTPRFQKIADDFNTSQENIQEIWATRDKIISEAKLELPSVILKGMEFQINKTFLQRETDTLEKLQFVDYDSLSFKKLSVIMRIMAEFTYIHKELEAI